MQQDVTLIRGNAWVDVTLTKHNTCPKEGTGANAQLAV